MQKLLLIAMICLTGCSSGDTVYLCNGPQSKVYHKTNHCRGLKNCSTDIEAVSMDTATARHRRACLNCYPK